jgi:hypothetical protein
MWQTPSTYPECLIWGFRNVYRITINITYPEENPFFDSTDTDYPHHVVWDDDFFEKEFAETWECIQTVSVHQNPLSRFRVIVEVLPTNEQINFPGGLRPKNTVKLDMDPL